MLEASRKAVQFAAGRSRSDLEEDEVLAFALTRVVEIVCEASRETSEEVQQLAPKIEWRKMSGTRNRVVHAYFDVDLDVLWAIVTIDLPPMIEELERLQTLLPPDD